VCSGHWPCTLSQLLHTLLYNSHLCSHCLPHWLSCCTGNAAQHEPTSGPLCLLCIPGTLSSPGLSLSPLRAKHSCHLSGPSSCPPVHLTLTPQPSYLLQHSSTILHSSRSFLSPAARVEALGLQEFLCTVSPDPQITAGTPYLLNN
jgi:hypothetical protein